MGNSSGKQQYEGYPEGYSGYGRNSSGDLPYRPPYQEQRHTAPFGYQHPAGGHRSRAAQQRSKSAKEHYEVLSRGVDTESPIGDDYQYNGYERLSYGQNPPRQGMVYHPPRVEPRPTEDNSGPQPVYINPQPYPVAHVYPPHPAEAHVYPPHQAEAHVYPHHPAEVQVYPPHPADLPPRAGSRVQPVGLAQTQYVAAHQQPQYVAAQQQPVLAEFYQPQQGVSTGGKVTDDPQLVTDEMRRAADEAFMGKGHVSQAVTQGNGDKRLVRFKARDRRSPDRLPNGDPVGQTVVRLDSHQQQPRPKGSPILKRRSAPHERGWPLRR